MAPTNSSRRSARWAPPRGTVRRGYVTLALSRELIWNELAGQRGEHDAIVSSSG